MITLWLIVNKYLSSNDISFSNLIPWSFVQNNLIGDSLVSLLFSTIDQIESELGISIFLSEVTKPLSIKYPFSVFLGPKTVTFSLLSKEVL